MRASQNNQAKTRFYALFSYPLFSRVHPGLSEDEGHPFDGAIVKEVNVDGSGWIQGETSGAGQLTEVQMVLSKR